MRLFGNISIALEKEPCKTIALLLKMAIKALVANAEEGAGRKLDPYCGKPRNKIYMSTVSRDFSSFCSDRSLENRLIQ
jgi:hypothetical protein